MKLTKSLWLSLITTLCVISSVFSSKPLIDDNCEHRHFNEQNIVVIDSNKLNKITFNDTDNFGELIVKANYSPTGCIDQTIWTTSDGNKVTVNPIGGDYAATCKLIAVSKFDDNVTITAVSKIYNNIRFSINVSWKSRLTITPLMSSLTLDAVKTYNCPANYSVIFEAKKLSELFSIEGSTGGLTYSLNNSNAVIDGLDIKANTTTNNATSLLTATANEDSNITATIPITINYSVAGNSTTHTYVYASYKTKYENGTPTITYGDWIIDTPATTSSTGSEHRTISTSTPQLRWDSDKYVCKYCGAYYWTDWYRFPSGDKTSTSTTTETQTIPKLQSYAFNNVSWKSSYVYVYQGNAYTYNLLTSTGTGYGSVSSTATYKCVALNNTVSYTVSINQETGVVSGDTGYCTYSSHLS